MDEGSGLLSPRGILTVDRKNRRAGVEGVVGIMRVETKQSIKCLEGRRRLEKQEPKDRLGGEGEMTRWVSLWLSREEGARRPVLGWNGSYLHASASSW